MNCKTCDTLLDSNAKFCSHCGAKIVHDRLSFKGTMEEFIGPFLSWENNFWRTFVGLFKTPKEVLEAYIHGARKKYFQPFSYLILYTTIAVLFYKLFPLPDIYDFTANFSEGAKDPNVPQIDMKKFYSNFYNYYNFIIILTIPLYSLLTYLTFKRKGNNFFEHLVFNSYLQTNIGYVSIVIQILLLHILHQPSPFFTIQILFSVCFSVYAFKKLYLLSTKQIVIAILKFWGLALLMYLILTIIIGGFVAISMLLSK
ncbi:DUF3667 domain-containing protein [Flavobacterium sp. J27]|uniref:DUF3667 domain-containing protein n=1 Tax=Flavobacterium sp. J27 TaxID=2060419 RepID=UPI001031B995|nr:DUF3667 domain-containing protein [Flavobacterium sp. J27]